MLTIKPQGKIIERLVRTKAGEQVLATFYVAETNGELQVRLISVKPISHTKGFKIQDSRFKNSNLCLRGECLKSPANISYRPKYSPTVSPFFSIFEFFVSQPTRAPSY